MRKLLLTLAPMLLVAQASASTAPTVGIEHPAQGATVSANAGELSSNGTVAFDEPVRSTQKYYLRTASCSGTSFSGRMLSVQNPGTDTSSPCHSPTSRGPSNDVTRYAESYPAFDGVPFVMDASRPVTGVLTMSSLPVGSGYAGVGTTTIDVRLESYGGNPPAIQDIGATSVSYSVAATDGPKQVAWSITPRSAFDKQDITYLFLHVTIRGMNVLHGYTVYNGASHLTFPTWSASFARKVEVAIDDPANSWTPTTLSQDLDEWEATLPIPEAGDHTLYVRAAQGRVDWGVATYSEIASTSFMVG